MEFKHISLALAAVAVAGFTACQEEDFGYTSRDILYQTDFVKTFGDPDPNQNWSTISTRSVGVSLPEQGTYTIYITNHKLSEQDDDILLYAQLDGVTSNGEALNIDFDFPKGYDHAYVSILEEGTNRIATRQFSFDEGENAVSFEKAALTQGPPTPPKLKKSAYIVAFEDLGGTCDWDFNDVVLSISHITGQPTVDIKILAVGGTLPVSLMFCDDVIPLGDTEATELHQAFGVDKDVRINVELLPDQEEQLEGKVADKPALLVSLEREDYKSFTMAEVLQNFFLSVNDNDVIAAPREDKTSSFPQAILIAKSDWEWPAEGQNIDARYPDFSSWLEKAEFNTFWYGQAWYDDGLGEDEIGIGTSGAPNVAQAKRR